MTSAGTFRYDGYHLDPRAGRLTCRYSLGGRAFREQVTLPGARQWDAPGVAEAARLVFLLAGVSYYKTAAPPLVDLGQTPVSATERSFLRGFYLDGLGEYAYRNCLDLSGLQVVGQSRSGPPDCAAAQVRPAGPVHPAHPAQQANPAQQADPVRPGRPLVPFGGGIDSIVTTEAIRRHADPALFIVSRPGDRFDAIERPAAVSGLPVIRAEREIDPQLLRSRELGFLNGHVPVTGILSAIAVLAAVLDGRDAVVMSNEWSASIPTMEAGGKAINHQYSKSMAFESAFRDVLAGVLGRQVSYFSALRPFTELWVAKRFAGLTRYHDTFRSCNRAFHIDTSLRLDHWCGRCDKCCFIDLILAPFMTPAELGSIFGGREPLTDPGDSLAEKFRALLGTSRESKPFECVGDIGECRAALRLAAGRPDRADAKLLHSLAADLPDDQGEPAPAELLRPMSAHFIPEAYATDDLLV